MILHPDKAHIREYDEKLVAIVRDFLILGPLSWPKEAMRDFLRGVKQGRMRLPKVEYSPPAHEYNEKIEQLASYIKKLRHTEHPALEYLRETAESYLYAYRLLQGVGTNQVSEYSKRLYGSPQDQLPGYKRSNIEIARYFLRIVEEYRFTVIDEPLVYSAAQFRAALQRKVSKVIPPSQDVIQITIDSDITARATAGPNYVKIRRNARFSEMDLNQLFAHEVMVHTLTYINGRRQPVLSCLGYAAPRTTATQEGLAMFAEYINRSIDLTRLRRIALRIIAIDMAEKGADLIDLYRFYRLHGQDEEESYYSAMRILRGGKPEGGIVFYKDNVYLRGLIEVSGFFKHAMHQGMLHDVALMFCGKMATQDVVRLQTLSDEGLVDDPAYMPEWAAQSSELAAHLAFNDLTERFKRQQKDSVE